MKEQKLFKVSLLKFALHYFDFLLVQAVHFIDQCINLLLKHGFIVRHSCSYQLIKSKMVPGDGRLLYKVRINAGHWNPYFIISGGVYLLATIILNGPLVKKVLVENDP